MERNLHSFRIIIKKGYSPCLYTYDVAKMPLGEFEAILDFKTWSKRIIAINCYFTRTGTGEKFVVTVYCNYQTARYTVANSKVDFSIFALRERYKIAIAKNPRGKCKMSASSSQLYKYFCSAEAIYRLAKSPRLFLL